MAWFKLASVLKEIEDVEETRRRLEKKSSKLVSLIRKKRNHNTVYQVRMEEGDWADDVPIAVFLTEREADRHACMMNERYQREALFRQEDLQHSEDDSFSEPFDIADINYAVKSVKLRNISDQLIMELVSTSAKRKTATLLVGIKTFRTSELDSNCKDVVKMISQMVLE